MFVTLLLWNAALAAAPTGSAPRVGALTYLAASVICHQQPARSFHRGGAQYPVCARCHGLYVGGLCGVAAWALFAGAGRTTPRRAVRLAHSGALRWLLGAMAAPTLLSVGLAWAGVWDGPNMVRAALALPLGAVIASTVAAIAAGDLR